MKWAQTTASKCRYGDVAKAIFGDAEIIWEHSEHGCQGFAIVLARLPNGKFVYYEWTYGSCSGCDEWEARDLDDVQVEAEMRKGMAVLSGILDAKKFFKLEGKHKNANTNGSIRGDVATDFQEAGAAFATWLVNRYAH